MKTHPKTVFTRQIPPEGAVLDVGCWNYSYFKHCEGIGFRGLRHHGIDLQKPVEAPPDGYVFAKADVNAEPFPFPDESFDAVVASHVIEHLSRPLLMIDEIFRVLKPGGRLYLECPSDRSLWLPSMPFKFNEFRSLNFFDDPTHVGRPHSPQSLYRLFRMYQTEVVECRYLTSNAVRIRFPYLLLRALLQRDAALLEFATWWSVGFCVYGITKKAERSSRSYVVSG